MFATRPVFVRTLLPLALLLLVPPACVLGDETDKGTSREIALLRVTSDIKYFAADERAGRLPGTPEMEQCVDYIVKEYQRIGLKPAMPDGTYLQTLDVGARFPTGRELIREGCQLNLTGPGGKLLELKLDEQFKPQLSRQNVSLEGGLVFVGYGIRAADEHNYDEYRNLDVKGKFVVIIRVEPQQANPDSVFDGKENSSFAMMQTKVSAARRAGAAGIILVNDHVTAPTAEQDELAPYDLFGSVVTSIPFVHVKRTVLDEILAASPAVRGDGKKFESLSAVEQAIDEKLEPVSCALTGWTAKYNANFSTKSVLTSNIVGVIEGEGPLANETIVIGGHYDHLGRGAYGSRAPGRNEIHNGADDNATGTAGVIELARRFAAREKKPARRLVFICFTAEEMGLVGAQHYVENPIFPLDNTVAMVNFDMIGWLRDGSLTVFSWNSGDSFGAALDRANQSHSLNLQRPEQGFAGSDHLPFLQRSVPVMFLHTGLTGTYHTPEDDFETINCDGALKVIEFTESLIDELANLPERPKFVSATGGARRYRLGAVINDVEGKLTIESIADDTLAKKIGLQPGDVILELAGEKVTERRQVSRLINANADKTVKLKIKRGEEDKEFEFKVEN